MTLANKDKKRKRTAQSPLPASRAPFKMAGRQEASLSVEAQQEAAKATFDHAIRVERPNQDPVTMEPAIAPPGFERPAVTAGQDYQKRRQALLKEEADNAWDYDARTKGVSENEKRAAIIIRELREYERRVVFGNNASEAIPGPETRDMGGKFLTNKERIESRSKLFEIAKEVPKGALLHLHFNAELNPERLLQEAQSMDNMYVWSMRPLCKEKDLDLTEMVFNVMPKTTTSNDIFSRAYQGCDNNWKLPKFQQDVWMKWSEFRERFPIVFPGMYVQTRAERATNAKARTCSEPAEIVLDPAENWIQRKMVLSEEEAYGPGQTVNGYDCSSALHSWQ